MTMVMMIYDDDGDEDDAGDDDVGDGDEDEEEKCLTIYFLKIHKRLRNSRKN